MKRTKSDEQIIAAHAQLREKLHRAPTAAEMAKAIGFADWGHARKLMDRLGLERYTMSMRERGKVRAQREKEAKETGKASYYDEANEAEIIVKRKIKEIRAEGAGGARAEKTTRAGYEFGENQMIRIACEVCGKQLMIRPRTHPYFVRRADGSIAWLCSAICNGIMQWKE